MYLCPQIIKSIMNDLLNIQDYIHIIHGQRVMLNRDKWRFAIRDTTFLCKRYAVSLRPTKYYS